MPAYIPVGTIPGYPILSCALGDHVPMWSSESPTPGGATAASRQIALVPLQGRAGFDVTGTFAGDPGMFQIDVQVAGADADNMYQLCAPNGTITTVNPTNFSFYFYSPNMARFVRLYMRNQTNAVNVTAFLNRT